jgi:redox-sensitive bicupin YhaK (pirin superfamily)
MIDQTAWQNPGTDEFFACAGAPSNTDKTAGLRIKPGLLERHKPETIRRIRTILQLSAAAAAQPAHHSSVTAMALEFGAAPPISLVIEFPPTRRPVMILIRKAIDRGHANHGWLDARHTFSFANYHHPDHMGFRSLRVINEDRIAPGAGFPPHSHRDMEIITYVLGGALEHKDSIGGGGVIRPGEVQYMCAGSGVTHSEYNASKEDPVHLLQIWLLPDAANHTPRYEQKDYSAARRGGLALVASGEGRGGSIKINQPTDLYASVVGEGEVVEHRFAPGRFGWLQLARGGLEIGGLTMQAGDGARIAGESVLAVKALADGTEFLLFDLN